MTWRRALLSCPILGIGLIAMTACPRPEERVYDAESALEVWEEPEMALEPAPPVDYEEPWDDEHPPPEEQTPIGSVLTGALLAGAVLSLGNLWKIISHFYWPMEHIQSPDLRRVLRHPVSLFLAVAVLVIAIWLLFTRTSVKIAVPQAGHELVVKVDERSGKAILVRDHGGTGGEARIDSQQGARILLMGNDATAILVVRDKYRLHTIGALKLENRIGRVKTQPVERLVLEETECTKALCESPHYEGYCMDELQGSMEGIDVRRGGFQISLREPMPLSRRLAVVLIAEEERASRYLEASDGRTCPPLGERGQWKPFWDALCEERQRVGGWRQTGATHGRWGRATETAIRGYTLEVVFGSGSLHFENQPQMRTVEACGIFAHLTTRN